MSSRTAIPSRIPSLGQVLIVLVSLTTSVGAFLADWNDTHIYHPQWLPHAKFHNGQTMSMGLLLGLATLWYAFVPGRLPSKSGLSAEAWTNVRRSAALERLHTTILLGTLYWVTQASAHFYPGVAAFDPVPGREHEVHDPLLQAKIEVVMLGMLLATWWLEKKRILSELV
ncbi:hypothetical protein C7974DRAFT_167972 [Boeremia exigua]|uniref:uncharacterized protein n=1 Tax=Boeremia exigua TaxID=749465 RepID=UPI001E8ECECD|nr:uncharacterized protein C7974DRAFT_167972 [Boeremia exigua]KAH6633233.1 hypothetical protein C7974DRAFT_167972 [Boeremia exigua]